MQSRSLVYSLLPLVFFSFAAVPEPGCDTTVEDEACYMGENRSGNTCYPVTVLSNPPSDYVYTSSCESTYGSNYRAPTAFLDLYTINDSDYLAPNFAIDELAQEWKGQYAVLLPHAVDRLQWLRDDLGPLSVNSGYRSPGYNASVDGASCSRHMYGDAFDMSPSSASLNDLIDACEDLSAGYIGVYESHIHCDWRNINVEEPFYERNSGEWQASLPELKGEMSRDGDLWTAPATGWDEGEPLREWTAYDVSGVVLQTHTGRSFEPVPESATVEVWIGRSIRLVSDILN